MTLGSINRGRLLLLSSTTTGMFHSATISAQRWGPEKKTKRPKRALTPIRHLIRDMIRAAGISVVKHSFNLAAPQVVGKRRR